MANAEAAQPGVRIIASEWRWAAAYALAVLLLFSAPYLAAVFSQTEAWRFGGALVAAEDLNSYFAKMNQGAHGAWLFTSPYTSEPQRGTPLYLFYLLLGKLAGADFAHRVLVYHLARVASGMAFLLAGCRFLAEFLPTVSGRRLALVLVTFGGGLGWLRVFFPAQGSGVAFESSLPLEFFSPEAFSFLLLFTLPHLLLAYRAAHPLWSGLALGAATFLQPVSAPIAWGVLGFSTLLQMAQERKTSPPEIAALVRPLVLMGLVSAPPFVYLYWLLVVQQWNPQYRFPVPPAWQYALAYGLYLPFALAGLKRLWRRQPHAARWGLAWGLLLPLLLTLLPEPNRRMVEGFQLPLAALTTLGLTSLPERSARWLRPSVLGLLFVSALLFGAGAFHAALTPAEPVFLPQAKLSAFRWLDSHARPGAVVLSSFPAGNQIPAHTRLTAYGGHGIETFESARKRREIAAFFAAETAPAERLRLLKEGRIRFVFYGPEERALGAFDPSGWEALEERFREGAYSVYEVRADVEE